MGWLTVAGSESSNLNINRLLLQLTRITCYGILNAINELLLRRLSRTLYMEY